MMSVNTVMSSRMRRGDPEWGHEGPDQEGHGQEDLMPEILVHIVEGRSAEAKKALMKDITDAVVKHFDVPPERVVVQIVESKRDSKSRGGVPFSEM